MSLKDESDHAVPGHAGWFGAALVFAAGVMAAFLLLGLDWGRLMRGGDEVLSLRAVNTRPMLILPLPRD